MDGITINNKQYIFVETSADISCVECDFCDKIECSLICSHFHKLIHGSEGFGVFKELKEEK